MFLLLLYTVALTHKCAIAYGHVAQYIPYKEPLYGVTSQEPRTWHEMRAQCNEEHPGYFLAMQFVNLSPEVVALCPNGTLVPFGVVIVDGHFAWDNVGDLQNMPISKSDTKMLNLKDVPTEDPYGAVLWPSMELRMIGNDTKFTCAVCEMSKRLDVFSKAVYPWHDNKGFAYDLELVSYDLVDDIGCVANGSDLVNGLLLDLAKAFNITSQALQWRRARLNEDQKAVVHVYYPPEDKDVDWIYYDHWNDEFLDHPTVKNFEITMIKKNTECFLDKKFLANVKRELFVIGTIDIAVVPHSDEVICLNGVNRLVTTRECYWDDVEQTGVWSKWVTWCTGWSETREMPAFLFASIFRLKGDEYRKALKNLDIMVVFELENQLAGFYAMYPLRVSVPLANNLLLLHEKETPYATTLDMMSYSIPNLMAKSYMRIPLYQNLPTELCLATWVNVLVSDRNSSDPVVGLAITLSDQTDNTQVSVAQLNHNNATIPPNTSDLVVTVSDTIAFTVKRLAIATYGAHLDPPNSTWRPDITNLSNMGAVQVTFIRDVTFGGDLEEDYIEIAFKPVFRQPWLRGKCAEKKLSTDEWIMDHCRILKSWRAGMVVCRCKNLHVEGNITTSLYFVYGFDASLSTYLKTHQTLVIVMACVCFMSALGLLSVVLTAFLFPEWRDDKGHKIFLQMTLALTVNLVLGFVNNFIIIDTKTVACIAIGVMRHYSFLAMFCWMMVLSGLQVKRLLTIAGAKATSHLILKVSAIAWGLPLIPIVILLAWDTGFYKSEVSNRDYCYPEDIAFQATVQGPAGVILFANLIIFVVILNHIYGWFKCGKEVVVRKHTADDRAAQLRNLGNSIFVFFLFGFTWTFHFLSEEGIINSEFLFEFLFLITASFHLFMLSLFFILLDKKTRGLWRNAMGCKKTSKAKQ